MMKLMCLYTRASDGTHWRVRRLPPPPSAGEGKVTWKTSPRSLRPGALSEEDGGVVELGAPIWLEAVAVGRSLMSDSTVRMTTYGNEFRVFGGSAVRTAVQEAGPAAVWSFVDSRWTEEVIKHTVAHEKNPVFGTRAEVNPHEIMRNPLLRAQLDLDILEKEGGAAVFKVLMRIYPLLRHGGMHVVRRLRRMCNEADVNYSGTLPTYTFTGLLSYLGVRLSAEDTTHLGKLFSPGGELIDYRRFFALMESQMPVVRADVVKDAYAKLSASAAGGYVGLPEIMRHWDPKSHPDVRRGDFTEAEGVDEFLRQWDVESADGLVPLEVFMEYYGDISKATDNDEIFVELVRSSWGL